MDLEIKDRKEIIHISQGDVLVDTIPSPSVSYLLCFSGFSSKNEYLYSLIPLDGSGDEFDSEGLLKADIKKLIMDNRFIHYPKGEYLLNLVKR